MKTLNTTTVYTNTTTTNTNTQTGDIEMKNLEVTDSVFSPVEGGAGINFEEETQDFESFVKLLEEIIND